MSRDRSLSALRYGLGDGVVVVRFPPGVRDFLFYTASRPRMGSIQRLTKLIPAALSPRVKRPGREDVYLPQFSIEIKNSWLCISTPPYVFMSWCLSKCINYLLHSRRLSEGFVLWRIVSSSVGIAAGWTTDKGKRFFSPYCPALLRGPHFLLCNGNQGLFHRGIAAEAWSWPLTFI
jgi:hypothetical protein